MSNSSNASSWDPSISEEARLIISEEERVLASVVESLQAQQSSQTRRFSKEQARAREMTATLVAARTDEDRWQVASDEAVAHSLSHQAHRELGAIHKLIERPYFARVVLHESENGNHKEIEYKLGFASNTDARIIDWRKAPISKLYYEYQEGEEYCEEIQGRERSGTVALRNNVTIDQQQLNEISCREGSFTRSDGAWRATSAPGIKSRDHASEHLPPILSLITPEQFATITTNANTAILIQGVAGTGKTTVALHRLAWLLHESNGGVESNRCLVVVITPALKRYISDTLPAMEVERVAVQTVAEWLEQQIKQCFPQFAGSNGRVRRPRDPAPRSMRRLLHSASFLRSIEAHCSANRLSLADLKREPLEAIASVLRHARRDISEGTDEFLSLDTLNSAARRLEAKHANGEAIDYCDDAVLIRLWQCCGGELTLPAGELGKLDHLVADEAQDYDPLELACLLGATKAPNAVTLVGDVDQQLDSMTGFPGWEALRRHWSLDEKVARFLTLTISHRCTGPIMAVADHLQGKPGRSSGRAGLKPIWFQAGNESEGTRAGMGWIAKAIERYPHAATAVLCPNLDIARHVFTLLRPRFGPLVELGDQPQLTLREGILVTEVSKVKGLEFMNILLWNPSLSAYPNQADSRNALYVAVTRARENLALTTWRRPSPLLASLPTALFRIVDLRPEEEEQIQAAPNS